MRVQLDQLTGPVTWSLGSGNPGSLVAPAGNAINYLPPAAGSVLVDTPVRVTASAGGKTATTDIMLHPAQALTLLLGPTGDDPQAANNPLLYAGGIARDGSGNMYVSDRRRKTIIKLTANGVLSQFATSSTEIGALAFDGAGNLYGASDTGILKFSSDGSSTVLVGRAGFGSADGPADVATFRAIRGMVATSNGTLYVTDNRTVRKVDPGGYVTTIAGHCDPIGAHDGDVICASGPSVDGDTATARFTAPGGIALDDAGTLYIHDGAIRTVRPNGVVSTLVAEAVIPASGSAGIARDPAGNIYIASRFDNTVLKVTPGGSVTTLAYAVSQSSYVPVLDVKYIDAHTLLVLTANTVQLLALP